MSGWLRSCNRFEPALVRRVKLYTKDTPLFEQFGIQEEINNALRSKVWLKSAVRSSSTRPRRWWPSTSTPANTLVKQRGWKTPS